MALYISANTGLGDDFVPDGTKPLPISNIDFTPMVSRGIRLGAISRDMLKTSISNIGLNITHLNLQPHLPGFNELSSYPGVPLWVSSETPDILVGIYTSSGTQITLCGGTEPHTEIKCTGLKIPMGTPLTHWGRDKLTFCRRHYPIHFIVWKLVYFVSSVVY